MSDPFQIEYRLDRARRIAIVAVVVALAIAGVIGVKLAGWTVAAAAIFGAVGVGMFVGALLARFSRGRRW